MIDLANGAQVTRRPIQAEAAIMNPASNILALRSGTTVQMFNLDTKAKAQVASDDGADCLLEVDESYQLGHGHGDIGLSLVHFRSWCTRKGL